MNQDHYFHIARFTLEAKTPLSIGTGSADGVFDSALSRDANRLPAIPGTTLAGVLRHLYQTDHDENQTRSLFGYQEPDQPHADNGAGSRISIAWGALLNSQGKPASGLHTPDQLQDDPLLKAVLEQIEAPIARNRVRITTRGAGDHQGKFDRVILPAGHRFACELSMWSEQANDPAWPKILDLLRDPRLRIGGLTHSGLGQMQLIQLHTRCFDLKDIAPEGDAEQFRNLKPGLADLDLLNPDATAPSKSNNDWVDMEFDLKARDFWRIGQGDKPLGKYPKAPQSSPVLEERIDWPDGKPATRSLSLPIAPATAIKGALAHRTAYYANCLEQPGHWADDFDDANDWDKSHETEGSRTVRSLFGYSKHSSAAGDPTGAAGRVFINDSYIEIAPKNISLLTHNALDRYTGGVRNRLLFAEELLWRTPLKLHISLFKKGLDPISLQAFRLALDDLCEGRLALGAGAGKGHGTFYSETPIDLEPLLNTGAA